MNVPNALCQRPIVDLSSYAHMRVTANLYQYFEEKGFRNPDDVYHAPFQFGLNTKDHYFEWLQKNPEDQKAFNSVSALALLLSNLDRCAWLIISLDYDPGPGLSF